MDVNKAKNETLEDFKTAIESLGKHCPGIAFDFNTNTITFKFLSLHAYRGAVFLCW